VERLDQGLCGVGVLVNESPNEWIFVGGSFYILVRGRELEWFDEGDECLR
jgi:hypothetical protein